MGLFSPKQVAQDAATAFIQAEERFAASVSEEFEAARALLTNARTRAAERVAELHDIAHVAKNRAKYLTSHFLDGEDE